MKKDLINIAFTAETITTVRGHLTGIVTELQDKLKGLNDDERKRLPRLGLRNETFALGVIEVARQHPGVVPALVGMANLERDVAAREALLPLFVTLHQIHKLMEDTLILLGADIYGGSRAIYKTLKVVAEANGLAEITAELGRRYEQPTRKGKPGSTTSAMAGNISAGTPAIQV